MPQRKKRTEMPLVGQSITRRYHGEDYEARVVAVDLTTGRVAVEMGGSIYHSLSAAAKAIVGHEVNGWRFWRQD